MPNTQEEITNIFYFFLNLYELKLHSAIFSHSYTFLFIFTVFKFNFWQFISFHYYLRLVGTYLHI